MMRWPESILMAVFFFALAYGIASVLTGCHATVGPFVPPGARLCDSDSDCPDKTHCAFPAPGWKARCMAGDDGLTTPPDELRRKDAGP